MSFIDGPDFTSNGDIITINVGDPLMIDCRVSDSNPDTIQYVNISGSELSTTTLSDRLYTVIESVTAEYNGRNYTCTASNGETTSTLMYTVYVQEQSTCECMVEI